MLARFVGIERRNQSSRHPGHDTPRCETRGKGTPQRTAGRDCRHDVPARWSQTCRVVSGRTFVLSSTTSITSHGWARIGARPARTFIPMLTLIAKALRVQDVEYRLAFRRRERRWWWSARPGQGRRHPPCAWINHGTKGLLTGSRGDPQTCRPLPPVSRSHAEHRPRSLQRGHANQRTEYGDQPLRTVHQQRVNPRKLWPQWQEPDTQRHRTEVLRSYRLWHRLGPT